MLNFTKEKIAVFFILTLLLFQSGCKRKNVAYPPRLVAAERLMEEHPDSAMMILDTISVGAFDSAADRAFYNLLLTQARYKNYQEFTADSIIASAVDFYRDSQDSELLMRALYYHVVVARQLGRSDSDIVDDVFRAEEIARSLDSPLWIARTNDLLAEIFYESYNKDEAMHYNDIAIYNYEIAKKYLNYLYSTLFKASVLTEIGKYDESLSLMDSLSRSDYMKYADSTFVSHYIDAKLSDYIYLDRYSDADSLLNKRLEYNTPFSTHGYIMCAYIYNFKNQLDIAGRCVDLAIKTAVTSSERYEAWKTCKFIYAEHLDLNALKAIDDSVQKYETRHFAAVENTVSSKTALSVRDNNLRLKFNEKSDAYNTLKYGLIIIVIIGLIFSISLIANVYKTYKQGKDRETVLLEIADKLYDNQYKTLNMLCNEYLASPQNEKDKVRIYNNVRLEILKVGNEKNLNSLIDWVDRNKERKLSQYFDETPELSLDEKKLITFSIAGFSSKAISMFMNLKLATFYTNHRRLREKVLHTDSPLRHWIAKSMSLKR